MLQRRISLFPAWARVLGLVLALLLPQLLGLLHGVAHGVAYLSAAGSEPTLKAMSPSSLAFLFASHGEGSPDCRRYDQASHDGMATTVATLSLPLNTPSSGVALFACDALARWVAQFDARGPPLTS